MRKAFFILSLLVFNLISYSQDVSCDKLISYVKSNRYKSGSIGSYQLIDSGWLKSVNAYTVTIDYNNVIFVIAEIKQDEWGTILRIIFSVVFHHPMDSF